MATWINFKELRQNVRKTVDLSEGGARLQSAQLKSIPDRFDLLIHFQAGKIERHHCQVVWKGNDELGLSFQPAGSPWQPARGVN